MRKPRELKEGARYHVTARANNKAMILGKAPMKELFIAVVRRAKTKYRFQIENFCIMGNHIHLIIRPGKGESLSAIMRWIMSVFAMTYNRICGTCGHVWGGRFFSRIIRCFHELVLAFGYIDGNPVRANQVENPMDWIYGGLWHARAGCREILDGVADWMRPIFPERAPFLLGYSPSD